MAASSGMASLPDLSALRSHGVNYSIIFQRSQSSAPDRVLRAGTQQFNKVAPFLPQLHHLCVSSFYSWASLLGSSDSEPSDAYSPYDLRATPWGH